MDPLETTSDNSAAQAPRGVSTLWVAITAALVIGVVLGRTWSGGGQAIAADPTNEATATREAELTELHDLQTQVAATVVCVLPTETATPMPSPTATTVPAVEAGHELNYGDDWKVTISMIANVGAPDGMHPRGMYVRVSFTMTNLSGGYQTPPFNDWRLVDDAGNVYRVDADATAEIVSKDWGLKVAGNETVDRGLVFDVNADAGNDFVLESKKDPNFRIHLVLEARG